jgi:hypothetical protein
MQKFDFEKLQKELENAARQAFNMVRKKHSKEDLCAYALYSDEDAMSVSPAVNSSKHLKEMEKDDPSDADYYKWSPAEWAFEFEGAEYFENISLMLREHGSKLKDDGISSKFKKGVFDTCVKALEALVSEGFFGDRSNDIIVLFTVTDFNSPDQEIEWVRRLNPKNLAENFEKWIASL